MCTASKQCSTVESLGGRGGSSNSSSWEQQGQQHEVAQGGLGCDSAANRVCKVAARCAQGNRYSPLCASGAEEEGYARSSSATAHRFPVGQQQQQQQQRDSPQSQQGNSGRAGSSREGTAASQPATGV